MDISVNDDVIDFNGNTVADRQRQMCIRDRSIGAADAGITICGFGKYLFCI